MGISNFVMGYVAPQIPWHIDPGLQADARKLAWFLGLAWLCALVYIHAMPSKRGGGNRYGKGMAFGAFTIVSLLDLNLVDRTLNKSMQLLWWFFSLFGIVS